MGNMFNIGFIVHVYDTRTDTHLYHKYALISALQDMAHVRVISISMKGAALGGMMDIMRAHRAGFRDWYVHYSFKGALAALVVTRLLGGRVFYWNCGMPWLYKRGWFEEYVFRFILRHTLFVTGTRSLAHMYAERYGLSEHDIRVVPNGIDTARFSRIEKSQARMQLGIAADARIVLFLHHMSRRKGAHLLPAVIEACKDSDVFFVIVGSGPYEEELRREIARRGLSAQMRLVGAVPHADVPTYLAAADVFLMPSEEEGFPHVLLEAMAAGVPAVASDVGGVREIVPPELAKRLCPSGDSAAFARAVSELLANPRMRDELGAVERAWAGKYDISVVRDMFIRLFERV